MASLTEMRWSNITTTKKVTVGVRLAIDVAFFIAIVVIGFQLEDWKKDGSKVPVIFDTYELKPYVGARNISTFYTGSYVGKFLCTATNNPTGCTGDTLTVFKDKLRAHTGCTTVRIGARPPMCAACVDKYADRMHAYAITKAAAILATDKTAENYKDELEACIARNEGARTVKYTHGVNPWLHLMLWTGWAMMYSATSFALLWTGEGKINDKGEKTNHWALYVVPGLAYAAVVVMYCVLEGLNGNDGAWYHDLQYTIFQLAVMALGYGIIIWYDDTKTTEITHTTLFGVFAIAAAPSIATIVHCAHAWLEKDMMAFGVGIVIILFVLFMLDDMLSVYWSKRSEKDAMNAEHQYLHAILLVTILFVIISYATTNFPEAPAGDPMSGQLMFIFLVIFLSVMAVIPTMLNEVTKVEVGDILIMKEVSEMFLRLVVILIMFSAYTKGIA